MRALWVIAVLAGPLLAQDQARLGKLIEQLLDDEISIRERAASDLVELGKEAVPALQKLRASRDPEARARADSVLREISENEILARHWRRGPRVSLDFQSAPLWRILEELARQGHDTFKLDPAQLGAPASVRVKEATFWDALDAVCRAAPALTWAVEGGTLAFLPKPRAPYPAKRQGEFCVWLESITYSRDYDFSSVPRSTFSLILDSAWESGITPVGVEQKITDIQDENGAAVRIPEFPYFAARLEPPTGRSKKDTLFVPVPAGAKAPRRFSLVRGTAAYYFPKTYEDASIDVQASPNPPPVHLGGIAASIRNFRTSGATSTCEVDLRFPFASGDAPIDHLPASQIGIVDDQGEVHGARSAGTVRSMNGAFWTQHESVQFSLPTGRAPVSIRLHVLMSAVEKRVAFEFRDIPVE